MSFKYFVIEFSILIVLCFKGYECAKNGDCSLALKSTECSNGTIVSKCYPKSYPNGTICTYEFIGDKSERIQLNFIDFSLAGNHTECYYSDTIEILTYDKGNYRPTQLLCGSRLPGPILSQSHRMKMEFRGIYGGQRGFKFEYSFITNFGITSGEQIGHDCEFNYVSNETQSGVINSPNFPGVYPINMECNYYFYGSDEEIVELRFSYFDVEGVFPCYGDDVASDSIEFSNYNSRDRKHKFYCGQLDEFAVASEGKFFRVTFRSNSRFDGTGFKAFYKFVGPPEKTTHYEEVLVTDGAEKKYFQRNLIILAVIVLEFERVLNLM